MGVREIGKYLRDSANEHGMSIAAVSAAAGVEPNYIWRLENGKIKKPGVQTLKALTDAAQGVWDTVSGLLGSDESLTQSPRETFNELAESLSDDEIPDAIAAIRRARLARSHRRQKSGAGG